jgi:hypothetical protein
MTIKNIKNYNIYIEKITNKYKLLIKLNVRIIVATNYNQMCNFTNRL